MLKMAETGAWREYETYRLIINAWEDSATWNLEVCETFYYPIWHGVLCELYHAQQRDFTFVYFL